MKLPESPRPRQSLLRRAGLCLSPSVVVSVCILFYSILPDLKLLALRYAFRFHIFLDDDDSYPSLSSLAFPPVLLEI
jgi:hypothetical protein